MKKIKIVINILLIIFNTAGCSGGNKMKLKKNYTDAAELKQDIVNAVSEQYGMQFEIGKGLDGSDATIGVRGKDYGFYGNLRPTSYPESYKKYNIYTDYTVADDVYFETQAHVRIFEEQLKADVDKIFNKIGMKYDIIEFRGMSRDINKWSKNSSYEQYKRSKDFETWIYIKLPGQIKIGIEENSKYYASIILPIMKSLYSALEPDYNVTLIFYLDNYHYEFFSDIENKLYEENYINPDVVWLDLSKFNNYLDWTEHDIETEIRIIHEDYFITAWKKANGIE